MGWPLGKAPKKIGEQAAPETVDILQGTTPVDMQRILGAQYMTAGLLPNGGLTVEGTSGMAYLVRAGAAFMWTSWAARRGMLVPVEETTVATLPAPATGSRIDTIYVDGEGAVRVVQGAEIPSGVAIARFTVPAGITATTSAQQSIDRDYAIGTGQSLGRLTRWQDPGGGGASMSETVRHTSRFHLPSDRLLRFDLTTTLRSATTTPGEMYIELELQNQNGVWRRRMDVVHQREWDTRSANWSVGTREGENVVIVRTRGTGGGTWEFSTAASVTELSVWDAGPNR